MRALITGGGTGGHFYPALSVMQKLREASTNNEIYYLGTGHGLESKLVLDYEWINFIAITVRGLSRQSTWRLLLGLVLLPVGMVQGLYVVLRYRPDVIYGTGGYASFPVGFWGAVLRIPVVIHELNVKPGLTNRLLAPIVAAIAISFRETERYLPEKKCILTGTPVRPKLHKLEEITPETQKTFGLDPDSPIIMVFGGSKGSSVLVDKVIADLEREIRNTGIQFLIQTGDDYHRKALERLGGVEGISEKRVRIVRYIDDMDHAYSLSDLVICRGGASTMAELIVTEKPAIVVPWAGSAEDHQYYNATSLSDAGAAITVREEDWWDFPLVERLNDLIRPDPNVHGASNRLEKMSKHYEELKTGEATGRLLDLLEDIVHEENYANDRSK